MKRNHKVLITLLLPTFGALLYKQVIEPLQGQELKTNSIQTINVSTEPHNKPDFHTEKQAMPYLGHQQTSNGSFNPNKALEIEENDSVIQANALEQQLTILVFQFKEKIDLKPLNLEQDKFLLQTLSQNIWETGGAEKLNFSENLLRTTLPSDWAEVLVRLTQSLHSEEQLHAEWQDRVHQEPEVFKHALLRKQASVLGEELFALFYEDEKHFKISQDGLHGQYLVDTSADERTISDFEGSQTTESAEHEVLWLSRLTDFLDEYQYIEQSGISGSDAELVRQELIDRHFAPEEQSTIMSFLFNQNNENFTFNLNDASVDSKSQMEANL